MIHITFILEDLFISADYVGPHFHVTMADKITAECVAMDIPQKEFGAIMYLAAAGDDDTVITDECYKLAEPVIGHLPIYMRPIP